MCTRSKDLIRNDNKIKTFSEWREDFYHWQSCSPRIAVGVSLSNWREMMTEENRKCQGWLLGDFSGTVFDRFLALLWSSTVRQSWHLTHRQVARRRKGMPLLGRFLYSTWDSNMLTLANCAKLNTCIRILRASTRKLNKSDSMKLDMWKCNRKTCSSSPQRGRTEETRVITEEKTEENETVDSGPVSWYRWWQMAVGLALPLTPASRNRALVWDPATLLCSSPLSAGAPGKSADDGRSVGPLPPLWETQMRLLLPGSSWLSPGCRRHLGNESSNGNFFDSLSLVLCLSNKS